ncbi:oleosin-B6-like [Setaria italica]|uniref:oleosin-B6-like n=1 Tax=Setaria italica TaxID=4555 RepID=UPI000350CED3|nr:oleosin-B6-like [Setaria italica]
MNPPPPAVHLASAVGLPPPAAVAPSSHALLLRRALLTPTVGRHGPSLPVGRAVVPTPNAAGTTSRPFASTAGLGRHGPSLPHPPAAVAPPSPCSDGYCSELVVEPGCRTRSGGGRPRRGKLLARLRANTQGGMHECSVRLERQAGHDHPLRMEVVVGRSRGRGRQSLANYLHRHYLRR